ncbi:hypothetical protein V462_22150 [Pantoea ananatis 15320]|nr:hypothetical protein V462_22150 [Pantoea ananatis 15320]PWW18832.1 hypothetical protein DFO57_1011139 [Pantoea sp. AG702]
MQEIFDGVNTEEFLKNQVKIAQNWLKWLIWKIIF